MDQLYFEDGYYEGKYFVYTADASVSFTPYIASQYIDADFFQDAGSVFTLTGTLTRQTYQQFAASFTSAFTFTGLVGRRQSAVASLSSAFTTSATVVKTARVTPSLSSAVTVATVSQKTARSSVTLSSIANLSAQAARFRDTSSSIAAAATATTIAKKTTQTQSALASAFTSSSQAQRSRTTTASLASVATQTSTTIKTARASIGLTSAFAPVITANASVSNGAGLTASFALSVLTGVRRQFPLNQLTGIGATSSQYAVIDFNTALYPPYTLQSIEVRDNYWTFSAWVKRDSVNGEYQAIAEGVVFDNPGGITLKNNDVRIRFNYDPDEPGAQWNDVAPTDTEWHHYLFRNRINTASSTYPVDTWDLWIDGLYKNTALYQAAGDITFGGRYGSGAGTLDGRLRLGYGLIKKETGSYDLSGAPLLGGVAQVWMGYTTDSEFRVERFYSGIVDMGATGTSTGLPTPVYYNRLTTPYTGVTWNTGAEPVPSPASTPLTLPSIQAQFSLAGESVTVLEVTVNAQSTSTLTGTIFRNRLAAATMTSTAALTVIGSKFAGVNSQLVSTASTTLISQRVRYANLAFTVTATQSAIAYRVKQFSLAVNSLATVTATGYRIQTATASVTARFTVSATINDRTRNAISLEMGAFTLTGSISRIRTATKALTSAFTVSCGINRLRPLGSSMTSAFTQTATPEKRIISFGNFTARFTVTSTAFKVVFAQANLQANGFVLSQGDILNFDPCREIKVDQETRLAKILPESRLLIVESETRRLKVAQETRVLRVDYETRVNILQC